MTVFIIISWDCVIMFLSFLLTQHKWRMFKKSKGKHDTFKTFFDEYFLLFHVYLIYQLWTSGRCLSFRWDFLFLHFYHSFLTILTIQLVNVYKKSNVKRDSNFAITGQSRFRLTVQWTSKPSRGDDSKNCHGLVSLPSYRNIQTETLKSLKTLHF